MTTHGQVAILALIKSAPRPRFCIGTTAWLPSGLRTGSISSKFQPAIHSNFLGAKVKGREFPQAVGLKWHFSGDLSVKCTKGKSQQPSGRWDHKAENWLEAVWGKALQKLPVLDRYLLGELLLPLLLGLAGFTFLAVSIGTGYEVGIILRSGVAPWRAMKQAAAFICLRLPAFVGLALPMAALLAPLLAIGQLNSSSEITALQASGVGPRRLLRIAACFFLSVALLHLALAEGVAPRANRAASDILASARSAHLFSPLSSQGTGTVRRRGPPLLFSSTGEASAGEAAPLRRLLYAQRGPSGSHLLHLTMVEMGARGQLGGTSGVASEAAACPTAVAEAGPQLRSITSARVASWDSCRQTWLLHDGTAHIVGTAAGESAPPGPAAGAPLGGSPTGRPRGAEPRLTLRSVERFDCRAWQGMAGMSPDVADLDLTRSTDDFTLMALHRMQRLLQASHNFKESRRLQVKVQQRLSLPAACLVLGLLGAALGLCLPCSPRLVAVSLTLAVVFSYYALSVVGALLAQLALIRPFFGAWLPNLVGISAMVALLVAGPK